jgi:hypothetical protein
MTGKASALSAVLTGLVVVALGGSAWAVDGVGALFDLGVSARSLGVGGACAAFIDDAAAAALNPAGLAWVEGISVTSLYIDQFGGATYGAAAFSAPYVGVTALLVDSGWITSGDTGFRYTSQALSVAAGAPIGPVAAGLRWRFLRSGSPAMGHGWAADGALLVDLGAVHLGAVWDAAVSSPMMYGDGETESWASNLRVGASVSLAPVDGVVWSAAADVERILHGPVRLVGGVEVWVKSLAARLGWDGEGPTIGLSVRVSSVEIDWSCAARSDLGASHRVSLEVFF